MNKFFLLLAATFFSLCSSAQVINGDLDEDNDVTMNDAVLLVNDYVTKTRHYVKGGASTPFASDNSLIAGTWYESKTKTLTFNADGTTDYGEGYTYKCLPLSGKILLYNASGAPVSALDIVDCTPETLILSTLGSSELTVYTKTQPVVLITGITLSSTSLTLAPNDYAKLYVTVSPSDADNTAVVWASSDESVAKVVGGVVFGLSEGSAIITATAQDGSGVMAICTVTVPGIHNGHEYVDLGTGVKWATMNVGASTPEAYGSYFAWGAIKTQSPYDWVNCPYQTQNTTNYSSLRFTKYLGSTSSSYKNTSATDADAKKTVLDLADDVAHKNWGGNWRIPTKDEIDDLLDQCYWQWVTTYNGKSVNGYIVYKAKTEDDKGTYSAYYSPVGSYSVSDPHIFLPAAGSREGSTSYNVGERGRYWSSSLYGSSPYSAYSLDFGSKYPEMDSNSRCNGLSIRAVCQ